MKKPNILITCDNDEKRYYLNRAYVRAIEEAGGHVIMIPPNSNETINEIIEHVDGLFLTGGDDIHPRRWGSEVADHYVGKIDEPRYDLQHELLGEALRQNMPILGVCHGAQMLNVYFGGSLHQDIAHEVPNSLVHTGSYETEDRSTPAHEVSIIENSKLASILGCKVVMTNSFHHQAVKDLGNTLVATGRTTDGLIESIENPSYPYLIGVQWHPEELLDTEPSSKKLFRSFIAATEAYKSKNL